jgi:putative MATE family efflux protein
MQKSPLREVLTLAIPVSLEMLVALVMNFINQIVVGGLGATPIAAVGFSNSITFIAMITFGSIGGSVAIMASRAHGGGRLHELNAVVHAALVLGSLISAVFIAIPAFFPSQVLTIAGGSSTVVATGSEYLRLTSIALLPTVASRVFGGFMRSTGRTRTPLIATSIATVTNTVVGILLVYGVGPFPELGVVGAGYATLLASLLNVGILVFIIYGRAHLLHWELPLTRLEWRQVAAPLMTLAAPMALTELVWSFGMYLYNVLFQRLGDEPLAAAQIAGTLEGVFIVTAFGLMNASTALIGKSLGQGDAKAARQWVRRIKKASVVGGFILGAAYLASASLLPLLFPNVSPEVRRMAIIAIAINALFEWAKTLNGVMGVGVLPSGSDMKGVVLGDGLSIGLVGLPVGALLGLCTPLGLYGVVIGRQLEEVCKQFIFRARARRIDWERLAIEHGSGASLEPK